MRSLGPTVAIWAGQPMLLPQGSMVSRLSLLLLRYNTITHTYGKHLLLGAHTNTHNSTHLHTPSCPGHSQKSPQCRTYRQISLFQLMELQGTCALKLEFIQYTHANFIWGMLTRNSSMMEKPPMKRKINFTSEKAISPSLPLSGLLMGGSFHLMFLQNKINCVLWVCVSAFIPLASNIP